MLTEDAMLVLTGQGIFGFLGGVGLILMIIFRREIYSTMRDTLRKWLSRISNRIKERFSRGGD
ncbi:MAG: hypothetical protein ACXAAO_14300, partial [Candidatus Thorarchaeota archaeon]|jgi:hypothetical protein